MCVCERIGLTCDGDSVSRPAVNCDNHRKGGEGAHYHTTEEAGGGRARATVAKAEHADYKAEERNGKDYEACNHDDRRLEKKGGRRHTKPYVSGVGQIFGLEECPLKKNLWLFVVTLEA